MKKLLIIFLTLSISITYVFGQGGEKRRSIVIDDKTTITNEEEKKESDDERTYKKNAFGLDFGIGSIKDDGMDITGIDFGCRYMHYFIPYVGADFFQCKMNIGAGDNDGLKSIVINPQLMTGIRASSPQFAYNRMHAFSAFRFGFGVNVINAEYQNFSATGTGAGFCYEFEIGIHLTRTFYIAYAYNHQGGTVESSDSGMAGTYDVNQGYSAFRIGFNFGENTPYNK